VTKYDNDPVVIRDLLRTPATWAVVGLSTNRARTAYSIAQFLKVELGMRVVPIHPRAETVFGSPGYPTLSDVPDGTAIHVVDCFVNSSLVGAVIDEAIAQKDRLGIAAVWLQLGVLDEAATARARKAGLAVVVDACPRIEFPRLQPGDGSGAIAG
jgi:predicted CoA-binding protein